MTLDANKSSNDHIILLERSQQDEFNNTKKIINNERKRLHE